MTSATLLTPKKLMTVEEFLDFCSLPENDDRHFELVRGEVIELPPPSPVHGTLCANIAAELILYARQHRRGFIATNDSSVLLERDTVRGPDVAYFEHVAKYRDLRPKPSETPPFLAVEVLSPSDSFRNVIDKIKLYLNAGVKVVWLVDPEEQTISIHRPDGNWKVVAADQQLLGDPELPGFSYRVSDFFLLPGELPDAPPAT
jgi:Uma2 family endonuclease